MQHFYSSLSYFQKPPNIAWHREKNTHCRTRPGTVPGVGDNNRAPHSHSLCCSWGTGSRAVAYIFKVCCLRFFSPPHIYLGWPRPRCLSSATGVGEERRFAQFEAESPSAAKQLDAPSQHVDKQSIHTRVTAEQCACWHNELIQKDARPSANIFVWLLIKPPLKHYTCHGDHNRT